MLVLFCCCEPPTTPLAQLDPLELLEHSRDKLISPDPDLDQGFGDCNKLVFVTGEAEVEWLWFILIKVGEDF